MAKYFYVTEFNTRVFSRLCLLGTLRSKNSWCLPQLSWPSHYHFFDILLLLLFHSLPHLSFFVFSVSHQGSLELCILFLLLWRYRLSFCHFVLFLQPQLLFLLSSAFSTSLKSVSIPLVFSSSYIFALNLSLKSIYHSLTDRFITVSWGCWRLFRLFTNLSQIWPLAMLPFFALNDSRTRISWQRILPCCSVHSMLVLKVIIINC